MRHFWPNSTDDLVATITATDGTSLDAQPVAFSFDNGATWEDATWLGSAGTTRKAKLTLIYGTNTPDPGKYDNVLARVGDPGPAFRIGRIHVH